MKLSKFFSFFSLIFIVSHVNSDELIIEGKGHGSAISKKEACNIALDLAEEDAYKKASTTLNQKKVDDSQNEAQSQERKIESLPRGKGSVVTFNYDTGLVDCHVDAKFEFFFIEN